MRGPVALLAVALCAPWAFRVPAAAAETPPSEVISPGAAPGGGAEGMPPDVPPGSGTDVPGQAVAEAMSVRDPFKRINIAPAPEVVPRSELEAVALEEVRMLGVITGPKQRKAMIQLPDNRTFYVSESMRIGKRQGVITRILADRVQVREKIVNVMGQEEEIDSEIRLRPGGI